ncbi:DUF1801 domain-containing protein [Shimia abyssi]|uniref:YdhG-like domain-containing protein n=1 Tax=Shimia abyssi TaxID=1662395 RepID=A0A2P8F728_9RHOB|nr:DUF1801 domain-containing protein [Shimia abyssi]PSL17516.1 hypothetical protein CLV88_11780 [Shimia abyssi]
MNTPKFANANVAAAFAAYPDAERARLMYLRKLIFETAAETPGVGHLEETLKWGQPAYLTPKTKSGSTIRLGLPKSGGYALYAHCQTTIISDFAGQFSTDFTIEGNRGVHFSTNEPPPEAPLRALIRSALTYHLKK